MCSTVDLFPQATIFANFLPYEIYGSAFNCTKYTKNTSCEMNKSIL